MSETNSEDRKLLQEINLQLTSLVNGLKIKDVHDAEFKSDIKLEIKEIKGRVKKLELTGATNAVMMGNLNQIKVSLIKWFMLMITSGVASGFMLLKYVL